MEEIVIQAGQEISKFAGDLKMAET